MENVAMDPPKSFPVPVISATGPAAMDMFCCRTGVTGNNIRVISRKYHPVHVACDKCCFGEACQKYVMQHKH